MNRKSIFSMLVLLSMILGAFGAASPVFAANETTLAIAISNHNVGDTFTVPVTINTSAMLRGYQFDLDFDASRLTVNSVTDAGTFMPGCLTAVPPTIDNAGGHIVAMGCALLGGTSHGTGAGTLANINVTVKSGASNGKAIFSMPASTTYPALYLDAGQVAQSVITKSFKWVQVGPAAILNASVAFSPASGNPNTTMTLTVRNIGGSAMDSTDATVFTVAASAATPATATFNVSGLAAGASATFTQAYALGTASSSNFTITDSVFGINTSATYFAAISDIKGVDVDATLNTFITLTTQGAISFHPLALGANTQTANMNVTSNAQTWTVSAASTNSGNMAEWISGTGFVASGRTLHDKLVVSQSKRALVSLTGVAGTLIPDGKVENQSADAGEDYSLTYAQTAHAYDAALPATESYHLVATYTAAVSF